MLTARLLIALAIGALLLRPPDYQASTFASQIASLSERWRLFRHRQPDLERAVLPAGVAGPAPRWRPRRGLYRRRAGSELLLHRRGPARRSRSLSISAATTCCCTCCSRRCCSWRARASNIWRCSSAVRHRRRSRNGATRRSTASSPTWMARPRSRGLVKRSARGHPRLSSASG